MDNEKLNKCRKDWMKLIIKLRISKTNKVIT